MINNFENFGSSNEEDGLETMVANIDQAIQTMEVNVRDSEDHSLIWKFAVGIAEEGKTLIEIGCSERTKKVS